MAELVYDETGRLLFTKEMKEEYTILCPTMIEIHFRLVLEVMKSFGYKVELLSTSSPNIAQEGLKYVHNDTCYPALLVIGQFIDALNSGKYDVNKVALIITQTGGGCRASNYIHLLRKALIRAGYPQVPVIYMNLNGMEKNPGFSASIPFLRKMISVLYYGDVLMQLKNNIEPYEDHKGDAEKMVEKWIGLLSKQLRKGEGLSKSQFGNNAKKIVKDFASIPIHRVPKIKVGVVGEIYVKYAPIANNDLENFLKSQGCEVYVPGIVNFVLFKIDNRLDDIKLYGGNTIKYQINKILLDYLLSLQTVMIKAFKEHPEVLAPADYYHVKKLAKGVIGYGNKMGEGWLLTAEILELIEAGYENIVCAQPFGCLPNHICGKGMIRKINEVDSRANIVPIDYDPSATRVNQENRIKLMLSIAKEKLDEQTQNNE